ncbi:hypothetical protein BST13_34490 [Mycobacterium aquaticum]|uniref:Uncharacterized protein n=2 Tax=Mycobacterium aquaticum TaxID=1927124 RepID=A0A1X0A294_9MYCO|nr:hypothetical protein BST13_34490 [Mycobacterium aquaticum]
MVDSADPQRPTVSERADSSLRALVDSVVATYLGKIADYPADAVVADVLVCDGDLVVAAEELGCVTVGELSEKLLLMAVRPVAVSRLGDEALGRVIAGFTAAVYALDGDDEFTGAALVAYEDMVIACAERDLAGRS